MSLRKAIANGKEHRVEYGTKGQPFAKSVDETCRNHGGRRHKRQCPWCLGNRTYKDTRDKERVEEELKNLL